MVIPFDSGSFTITLTFSLPFANSSKISSSDSKTFPAISLVSSLSASPKKLSPCRTTFPVIVLTKLLLLKLISPKNINPKIKIKTHLFIRNDLTLSVNVFTMPSSTI